VGVRLRFASYAAAGIPSVTACKPQGDRLQITSFDLINADFSIFF
jgi:hypothetical protein